jgi:hypothetical protein
MVTIVNLVEAYSKIPSNSVWLVPGSTADLELEESEPLYPHVNDYLARRGICICSKTTPEVAGEIVRELTDKFQLGNVPIESTTLCND